MIKYKTFQKITLLVAWFNKPENETLQLVSVVRAGMDAVHAIYQETVNREAGSTSDTQMRRHLICRVNDHVKYPKTTKRKLKFPESILDFRVVPFTRIHNSLRNLKQFKGMSPKQLTEWMNEALPKSGYRIITRSEAAEEYGTGITLIEL